MPFVKGQSGNPAGRAPGSRNHRTLLAERLFDQHAESIVARLIELAEQGHSVAMQLCMDRILPRLRERPLQFELPRLEKPEDAVAAIAAITAGVADGRLTASEAVTLSRLVESCIRTFAQVERMQAAEPVEEIPANIAATTIEPRSSGLVHHAAPDLRPPDRSVEAAAAAIVAHAQGQPWRRPDSQSLRATRAELIATVADPVALGRQIASTGPVMRRAA